MTGGTIIAAAEQLHAHGASSVWVAATHGYFTGSAIEKLRDSPVDRLVVTNTVPLPPAKAIDKIEVLSVAPIIANVIDAVFEDKSVSELFDGENQS